MATRNVRLKNKGGDVLHPYTENLPTATTSKAGTVMLDDAVTANSSKAITSGAVSSALTSVNTTLNTKLGKTETAAKAVADAEGNDIVETYAKKGEGGGLGVLYNQLNKACAWTWTNKLYNGGVKVAYYESSHFVTNEISCTSFYENPGLANKYVVIDGKLYTLNEYSKTLNQFGTDTDYKMACGNVAIKNNGLYFVGSTSYAKWIDQTGTWSKVGIKCGIKNGSLGFFDNSSNTTAAMKWGIVDTGGVWTDIVFSTNDYCIGIRDGYLYYASAKIVSQAYTLNKLVKLSQSTDYTRYEAASSYFYCCRGRVVEVYETSSVVSGNTQPYRTITLEDDIVQSIGQYFLLSNGKLYNISSSESLVNSNVISLGCNYHVKSDGLYSNSNGRLALSGEFGEMKGLAVFIGASTVETETLYTVSGPQAGNSAYSSVNLSNSQSITAATPSAITVNSKVYDRNSKNDDVFEETPSELAQQTLTKYDLVSLIKSSGDA